ncbi:hypothetical protein GCM10023172_07940 [Hymenobacter ginsengisoli]|uniref:Glycosyltransferase RgtA/B/C/D-like domain-containing protein n=1 Tax=Hymenobacter ginsengisoli TaxID=1051626 RepID=A0ABP8Q3G2_9BACT|nr:MULTISPECIES: hypothetical protein [unclassified Hymenobacter]MBO2032558.1 hypothetical protein [Hymenobacter sp. BT559]
MELSDYLLTPFYLGFFYAIAYAIRPAVTNKYTKQYFIPAFSAKIVGGLALGILYHTIYAGDTNNYFHHASIIYDAFGKSFSAGLHLIYTDGTLTPDIAPYASQMGWFGADSKEYFVIRVAAVFAILGFNTYMVTTVCFAVLSFSGMWVMYITFAKIRPQVYKELAIAVFFLPSVFFWGSGLLKDSLCIGSLGWLFYAFYRGAIEKKNILRCLIVGVLAAKVIASMKVYILLAFVPPSALWVFNENTERIKSGAVRMVARPLFLVIGMTVAIYAMSSIAAADARFNIEKIGAQSKLTADYLQGVSKQENGSGYNIGEQDGTLGGMAKLAPQAIVVALFRPFIWEARNPTMALSALEASYFFIFTLRIFWRVGFFKALRAIASSHILTLCFIFSLIFAISVGISSGNFGTLVRYKIPLMPFYLAGLYILSDITQSATARKKMSVRARPQLA